MLEPARLVHIALPAAIFAALCRSWLYQRYPAFSVMVALVMVKYAIWEPGNPGVYRWIETLVMLAKAAAVAEVARVMMDFADRGFKRTVLRYAIAFGGVVVCSGWLLEIRIRPTELGLFNYGRVLTHWFLAGGLIALLAYNYFWPWRPTEHPDRIHAMLLGSLCLLTAITDSLPMMEDAMEWSRLNMPFRQVRISLWSMWLLLFLTRGRPQPLKLPPARF